MIICHCAVVRDHEIRTEVRLGAETVEAVSSRCGAGSVCGGCRTAIADTVVDELVRAGAATPARH